MLNLDESTKKGEREYHYLVTAENEVHIIKEEATAVSLPNYSTKNAIEYEYNYGQPKSVDPVIFTDGASCDLINIPREKDGKGCELWVNDKYKDNVPSCCSFIYDLLCSQERSYDIYKKDECKEVVESWPTTSKAQAPTMAQTKLPEINDKPRGNLMA
nr:male-specific histamine-binding salivary protein-like [Dermacentor andersoni]